MPVQRDRLQPREPLSARHAAMEKLIWTRTLRRHVHRVTPDLMRPLEPRLVLFAQAAEPTQTTTLELSVPRAPQARSQTLAKPRATHVN